jgi:hypothetical protein
LEEIAIRYVSLEESELRGIFTLFAILGGVLSALTRTIGYELARAPYFAYSMLIYLFVTATQLVWLGSINAMLGGYLFALMAVDVVAGVLCGYALAGIATARSRNAFGHGRAAALAFIPLANLVLLFARPRANSVAGSGAIPLMSGGLGVLSGFLCLIGTVTLSAYITTESQRLVDQAAATNPAFQTRSLETGIAGLGVNETLRQLASEVPVPETLDEVTTLVRVEADGDTLRYVYELSEEVTSIPFSMRVSLVNSNCRLPFFEPIFKADGNIQHLYLGKDGSEIGRVDVTRQACGL